MQCRAVLDEVRGERPAAAFLNGGAKCLELLSIPLERTDPVALVLRSGGDAGSRGRNC
jgi:hypothetical protein